MMNNKGFIATTSVFAVMLIVSTLIFLSYMPLVNHSALLKDGGQKVLSSIEDRNAAERIHAKLHNNPSDTGNVQYEDLNVHAEIYTTHIEIIRDGKTTRIIHRN